MRSAWSLDLKVTSRETRSVSFNVVSTFPMASCRAVLERGQHHKIRGVVSVLREIRMLCIKCTVNKIVRIMGGMLRLVGTENDSANHNGHTNQERVPMIVLLSERLFFIAF